MLSMACKIGITLPVHRRSETIFPPFLQRTCMPAVLRLTCSNGLANQLDHLLAHTPSLATSFPSFLQILFVIQTPDVFKSPAGDTYIIFGEVGVSLAASQRHSSAAPCITFPHHGSSSCHQGE